MQAMSIAVLPVSISITQEQLAWLDRRRHRGLLTRSAVLRQLLDDAIAAEAVPPTAALPAAAHS